MNAADENELWYETKLDVFLNRWYAKYDEARAGLEQHEGFLLPYRHHFYVCRPDVIAALGLDPADPDWDLIKHDCARPADEKAFQRLVAKRKQIIEQAARQ